MPHPVGLPHGTVTFLVTEIEDSTRLLRRLGADYRNVLARHRQILRTAFDQHDGHEFGSEDDALRVAFSRARDAAAAAVAAQLGLEREDWPGAAEVRVRIGLHTGEPVVENGGYGGIAPHKAARISAVGHGGQVLLSSTTRELVADELRGGLELRDLGDRRLKDLDRPERIYELRYPGVSGASAPVPTLDVAPVPARPSAGRPVLVQRREELAALETALEATRSGVGAVAMIEGPAGIGKTSLLRAARERAAEDGMTVLHARGTELERDFPLGLLRQCLQPALRREGDRDRLLRGAAQLVAPLLLDVPDPAEATPVGILHGLYWLIVNLAEQSPLVLAIDDTQWADEPSLRFLAYLARRVEGTPVGLFVGSRTDPEGNGVNAAALSEIRIAAGEWRIEPPPLEPAGVEQLLGDLASTPVDPSFARACHTATGGNPFLLGELVRTLRANGVAFDAAGSSRVTEVTPPTVARAVATTLARLGDQAAALANATAILGGGITLEQAARLADVRGSQAAAAADQLVREGIFDDGVLLEFRHPILAGAVKAGIPARERGAAHARAAALLRDQGASPERIGLQLLHATPSGDQEAVADLGMAAGRASDRGAPGTAAALLRRALAEPAAPPVRNELLLDLGGAERAIGRTTEAAEFLDEAYRCAESPTIRAQAVIAMMQATPGRPADRSRLYARAERTLSEITGHDRELALRLHAVVALEGGSVEGLSLTGASPGEAIVLGNLVFARMGRDATAAEIADLAERAAPWVDELLTDAPALAFTGVVLALTWADRLGEAERLLDHAVAVARRRGSATDYASAMTLRAKVHHRAGRLRDAEADARAALAIELESGWSFARGLAPLVASLLDQGRLDEGHAELIGAGLDEEIPDSPPMSPVLLARMRLRAARHDDAGALGDWHEAVRRIQRRRGFNVAWIEDLIAISDVHRTLGDGAAARQDLEQAMQLARRWDTTTMVGQALHAQARAGIAGDPIEILQNAVELLGSSPARLECGRALVSLGGALRRQGQRIDSREPLRAGYELARECGADALAETARAELRASGIRLRREALSGAASLTPSELRIADMALGGAANAEIAQKLFLTVKTVEMHLTNTYRKLDIHRRSELGQALGQHG